MKTFIKPALSILALAAVALPAAATNLVQNGSFEQSSATVNTMFGNRFGGQVLTGWNAGGGNSYDLYLFHGTLTTPALTPYGGPQTLYDNASHPLSADPNGGNFIALDGDINARGPLTQTINGLVSGQKYILTFDWGADQVQTRSGATTEQFEVSLGNQTQYTSVVNNASHDFAGWTTQSFTFTANNSSELLSFLSLGTPSGLPPIAVLDGVSLTAVPEPATWAMMLVGLGALGGVARLRRGKVLRSVNAD